MAAAPSLTLSLRDSFSLRFCCLDCEKPGVVVCSPFCRADEENLPVLCVFVSSEKDDHLSTDLLHIIPSLT